MFQGGENGVAVSSLIIVLENPCKCANVRKNEAHNNHLLKLRTTFFDEGEDDKAMVHRITTTSNSDKMCHSTYISEGSILENPTIQFGSFSCIVKHDNKYKALSASDSMTCKVFIGVNQPRKKNEVMCSDWINVGDT